MMPFSIRRRRVLIINGDASRVEALLLMAKQMTLEAVIAGSAREGFQRAQEMKPDLIMLDLMLPNMGGFALLRQLKDHVALARIPIIVLTAGGKMASGSECMAAAAAEFLQTECGSRVIRLALPATLC